MRVWQVQESMTRTIFRCFFALLCCGLFAGCASAGSDRKPLAADLQVQVVVPPTWRPIHDDDTAEAFALLLIREFRSHGYRGRIVHREHPGAVDDASPLLTVSLAQWRIGRLGDPECLFNARLLNSAGENIDLGMFVSSGFTSLRARPGYGRPLEMAYALEHAARDAVRDLFRRVAESGQVPNLIRKHGPPGGS